MSLAAGTCLGPYRITSLLGAGAMGEVYRARDDRLARTVAVKVLTTALEPDPGYQIRFMQEALATGTLNHPNVISVFDVGSENGISYIVSELLEGETLRDRLARGPIPQRTIVDYGVQIARGLAAAHEKGIVHRDLKPENLFLTKDGGLKILDFGLAKLPRTKASEPSKTSVPTLALGTEPGLIMGTVGYMSPEQVRGQPADHRSDIFSLGVILYEALACERAFSGNSSVETMSSILKDEPPDLPNTVILGLHLIVRRCLEKDPDRRFHSIQDLGFSLEAMSTISGPAIAAVSPSGWKTRVRRAAPVALASFLAGALLAVAVISQRRAAGFSVKNVTFAQVTDDMGEELYPSMAPDGNSLVYAGKATGNWDIYSKNFRERDAVNLTKASAADDTQPAISPDGKFIAFRSERDGGGMFVMNTAGDSVRRVADFGFNPSWSPDGKALVCADESITRPDDRQLAVSRLWIVDVASGRRQLLSNSDGVQPRWSPHGDRIAFWAIDRSGYRDIWTIAASGGQASAVTHDTHVDWNPVWSPNGKHLYFSSDRGEDMNVWRVSIHEKSGKVLGPPEPVTTPSPYSGHLDFSKDGRHLAYVQQSLTANLKRVSFDPLTQTVLNEPVDLMPSARQASRPALSPDSEWVAFNSLGKQEDIVVTRADGTGMRQLTIDGAKNRGPQFSPDGKRIAFFSKRSGAPEIWTINADGTNLQQLTFLAGPNVCWPIWSPDGTRLIYTIFGLNSFILDLSKAWTKQTPRPLPSVAGEDGKFYAWSWSPNGKSVAGFQQRTNGSSSGIAIYGLESGTFTRVSDLGFDPVWLSDNRRLLVNHRGRLYLVDTETKATREVLSIEPSQIAPRGFALSKDDRNIYFSVVTNRASVWLLTFDNVP